MPQFEFGDRFQIVVFSLNADSGSVPNTLKNIGFSILFHSFSSIADRSPGRVIERKNAFPPSRANFKLRHYLVSIALDPIM